MGDAPTPPSHDDHTIPAECDITTLVVDDQEHFRQALADLIASSRGFELVAQASSGEDAVRAIEQRVPDLVLIDVIMPGMGGIAAAREIRARAPGAFVVLVSVDDPLLYPEAAELDGTVACVRKQDLKPSRLRELWEGSRN